MKLCDRHWEELRAAIKAKGIWDLVASSGEALKPVVERDLAGKAPERPEHFDPLLAATFAIYNNGLRAGGLYLMMPDEEGNDRCPICEGLRNGHADCANWIGYAARDAAEVAKSLQPPSP